jgi:hypothetical protein
MIVGASGTLTLSYMTDNRIPYTAGSGGVTSTSNLTYTPGTTTFATANGTFSGTLGVTGLSTLAGGALFSTSSSSAQGKIHYSTNEGLFLRGIAGSTNDFTVASADAGTIIANPTGTRNLQVGHSSGSVTVPGNFIQSDGSHTISVTDNTANAVDIQQGSNNYINVNTTNSSENVSIGNATTNPTVSLLGTGVKIIDGTINTDLTASRTVITDGSGNLSVNAETGTGSHVRATSPTLVTPVLGAATATSIALGGGEAFVYGDTSFTLTGTTGWTTTPSGTAYATRVGNVVTLDIPYITGTSNSTSTILSGIPTGWRPTRIQQNMCISSVNNSGSQYIFAFFRVNTDGTITVGNAGGPSSWASSGTKSVGESGPIGNTITYQLQ